MVRGDSLHILYSRGLGSCTTCGFMTGLKGKESALPPGSRIFLPGPQSFKNFCQAHKFEALHDYRHTVRKKPHKAYPYLEAKAAETKHFLPCLEEVVKESLPEGHPIHHTMLDCLKAFNQISQQFPNPFRACPCRKPCQKVL